MGRQLRVLVIGRQDNFQRILATNIQCWGYEVIVRPSAFLTGSEAVQKLHGDVVLYDLDEACRHKLSSDTSPFIGESVMPDETMGRRAQMWSRNLLTIVLSSRSVSRSMLEQIGAVALLQKPFEMGRLQRYLQVFQRLLFAAQEQAPTVRYVAERMPLEKLRVLVVDDDIDVAQAICQCLLYEPGYEVAVAHDGLEALEQCLDWRPQCVVTDLIMPWMNGYQVMRCLAAGSLSLMPAFVVMSALTQLESPVSRSYLEGKAVAYVDKPFHVERLLTAIRQVCAE